MTQYGFGAAGTILQGAGNGISPKYSTATYPLTSTANQLLYSSATNTVTGLASANSGVLTTSSAGVPSIDTTNFAVLTTGVQMKGNNTNTAPPAGFIGEQITASVAFGAPVSLTTNTYTTVTSISLTAGIWDISTLCAFAPATTTTATQYLSGISTSNSAFAGGDFGESKSTFGVGTGSMAAQQMTIVIPSYRVVLSGTTTYYLGVQATFLVSTVDAYGTIRATRVG